MKGRAGRRPAIALAIGFALPLGAGLGACKTQPEPAPPGASSTSTSMPAQASAPAPAQPAGHLQFDEAPASGDVEPLVRDAMARAQAAHRRLLVYVGATWCEPCQRFHHAAAQGALDAPLPDVDVLAFDLDRDGERLASAGYVSKLIPLFALPKADGSASGQQVEGGIKGDGALAYMTPRIQALLAR